MDFLVTFSRHTVGQAVLQTLAAHWSTVVAIVAAGFVVRELVLLRRHRRPTEKPPAVASGSSGRTGRSTAGPGDEAILAAVRRDAGFLTERLGDRGGALSNDEEDKVDESLVRLRDALYQLAHREPVRKALREFFAAATWMRQYKSNSVKGGRRLAKSRQEDDENRHSLESALRNLIAASSPAASDADRERERRFRILFRFAPPAEKEVIAGLARRGPLLARQPEGGWGTIVQDFTRRLDPRPRTDVGPGKCYLLELCNEVQEIAEEEADQWDEERRKRCLNSLSKSENEFLKLLTVDPAGFPGNLEHPDMMPLHLYRAAESLAGNSAVASLEFHDLHMKRFSLHPKAVAEVEEVLGMPLLRHAVVLDEEHILGPNASGGGARSSTF